MLLVARHSRLDVVFEIARQQIEALHCQALKALGKVGLQCGHKVLAAEYN